MRDTHDYFWDMLKGENRAPLKAPHPLAVPACVKQPASGSLLDDLLAYIDDAIVLEEGGVILAEVIDDFYFDTSTYGGLHFQEILDALEGDERFYVHEGVICFHRFTQKMESMEEKTVYWLFYLFCEAMFGFGGVWGN